MIIAKLVQIAVITMMNTHLYEFNGKIYLQQQGGPIGLRATCAVARIVMNYWDACWMDMMATQNVETLEEDRYMDDIRIFLLAMKRGGGGRKMAFTFVRSGDLRTNWLENLPQEGLQNNW